MSKIEMRWLNITTEIWGDGPLPRYEHDRVLQYRALNDPYDPSCIGVCSPPSWGEWQDVPEEHETRITNLYN